MYKTRAKMPAAHRAKQFMPFAGVKGLQEALGEKEKLYRPKTEIAEDAAELLNDALASLQRGDRARVCYYAQSGCRTVFGEILCIDEIKRRLTVGGIEIPFNDILSVAAEPNTADES